MVKLNEIRDNEGAAKRRMRVGRGEGSGKGKTGGRGVKGQKARSGVAIAGFEGGQMPLHMRLPKRGFNNIFRKDYAEVNLWRLAQAIEAGKLDASAPIDGAALIKAGVIRREKDGVRLLGKGELKTKVELVVHSASASARQAIEAAGGKLTASSDKKADAAPAKVGKRAQAKIDGKAKSDAREQARKA